MKTFNIRKLPKTLFNIFFLCAVPLAICVADEKSFLMIKNDTDYNIQAINILTDSIGVGDTYTKRDEPIDSPTINPGEIYRFAFPAKTALYWYGGNPTDFNNPTDYRWRGIMQLKIREKNNPNPKEPVETDKYYVEFKEGTYGTYPGLKIQVQYMDCRPYPFIQKINYCNIGVIISDK